MFSNLNIKSVIVITERKLLFQFITLRSSTGFIYEFCFKLFYAWRSFINAFIYPILIKSSLHFFFFLLILGDGSIIVCLYKLIGNKAFIMSSLITCSLHYGRTVAAEASLLLPSFYKYCFLSSSIFIGSTVCILAVTEFFSFVLFYKMLS